MLLQPAHLLLDESGHLSPSRQFSAIWIATVLFSVESSVNQGCVKHIMKGHDNISNIWPELAEQMGAEVGSATWLCGWPR